MSETSAVRSSVWRWWKSIQKDDPNCDRAGRAELRRCGTISEVAFVAAYHRLLRQLGSRLGENDAKRVAVAAAVLAHIDTDLSTGESIAKIMGKAKGEAQGSIISDTRFRHLIRNDQPDELMRELIRIIRQLDRIAPIDQLFQDLMNWNENTRMRWAREYYEVAPELNK